MGSKLLAIVLTVLILMQLITGFTLAQEPIPGEKHSVSPVSDSYAEYLSEQGGLVRHAKPDVKVSTDKAFRLDRDNPRHEFSFFVEQEGFYAVRFDYCSVLQSNTNDHVFGLMLNGAYPFAGVSQLALVRHWQKGRVVTDSSGNDIVGMPQEYIDWMSYTVCDQEGYYSEPYEFYFKAGINTLAFLWVDGAVDIRNVILYSVPAAPSYEEYLKKHRDAKPYAGEPLIFEAENYYVTNSMSLIPKNDMTSANTTPYDVKRLRLNVLGGSNWKYSGQKVEWKVKVPVSGLYKIAIRYKQNYSHGLSAYRRLLVNGEVPFKEASELSFAYDNRWNVYQSEWAVYLKEGENSLSLECTLGKAAALLRDINETVFELNHLYREITTITGTSPDVYRDYNLQNEITDIVPRLQQLSKDVYGLRSRLIDLTGKNSSKAATVFNLARQLEDMADDLRSITKGGRLGRFKSNISSLASIGIQLREQPLLLDSFILYSPEKLLETEKEGFWVVLKHRMLRLVASFLNDYSRETYDGEPLKVWINTGTDQLQIIKGLIDNSFTPSTNIPVRLELVSGSVIQATLAGRGPDIALDRGESEVVNFAMRGALYDLSGFSDYGEVTARFSPTAMQPFKYKSGVYALPLTQNFNMMFVRNDIMEELGLEIPTLWSDFTDRIFPVLQRNNMSIGLGILNNGSSGLFFTLLYQMGGSMYTDDLKHSNMDSLVALDAFDMTISFYREYGAPREYSFINQFRTGQMPIGIEPYTTYNVLQVSAPEIAGLWDMYPIPGIRQPDGSVKNTQLMTSTAAVMFRGIGNPKGGWEFLKWWTSAEIQKNFGLQQEAALGESGRYAAANLEAIKGLPWSTEQIKMMEKQRSVSISFTHLPGSYFTTKAINNALVTAVTQTDVIPREQLLHWSEQINMELERKSLEFDF